MTGLDADEAASSHQARLRRPSVCGATRAVAPLPCAGAQ
jgi:hypothetical protein